MKKATSIVILALASVVFFGDAKATGNNECSEAALRTVDFWVNHVCHLGGDVMIVLCDSEGELVTFAFECYY